MPGYYEILVINFFISDRFLRILFSYSYIWRMYNLSSSKQGIEEHAEIYLDMNGFSKEKLIEQLIYEEFEKSEVEAVVESLNVDWKEQAVI